MAYTIIKYLGLYILGFCFFYIDGMGNTEGLSIGQIWKIPVIAFLAFKCINYTFENYARYRLGYAMTKLLNPDILIATAGTVSSFLKFLVLPLCLPFFRNIFSSEKTLYYLKLLAHIIIISFIPFYLGILEERHTYRAADLLGVDSLIGPFNNAHTSSIYLSTSILVLIFYVRNICENKLEKIYTWGLILVGLYFLMLTYVRTGYAMCVLGIYVILAYKGSIIRSLLSGALWGGLFYLAATAYIETNDVLNQRLHEETGYKRDDEINGSGRLLFWATSINLWANSDNAQEYLLGHGLQETMEQQAKENGLLVGSHNGFIDALVQNGLVGFLLLLLYYFLLIRNVFRENMESPYFLLFLSWLMSDIAFQFVQGGTFFFYDIMSALIITLPILETQEYENELQAEESNEEQTLDEIEETSYLPDIS
ncbi:MAG: O-antigen ligase family protein [Bacteroidaceae bacterium]|nr:O-antigen ligase family protein [Bacteroidaceae bacterium]